MKSKRRKLDLPLRSRKKKKKGRKQKTKKRYIELTKLCRKPVKCTEALIDEAVELILEGLPVNKTCDYLGITQDSYYEWKQKGETFLRDVASGTKSIPEYEIYAIFVQQVCVRAQAEWQLGLLRRSMQENSKHKSWWVRDMTMLERRDRRNWSRVETTTAADVTPLPDESYL